VHRDIGCACENGVEFLFRFVALEASVDWAGFFSRRYSVSNVNVVIINPLNDGHWRLFKTVVDGMGHEPMLHEIGKFLFLVQACVRTPGLVFGRPGLSVMLPRLVFRRSGLCSASQVCVRTPGLVFGCSGLSFGCPSLCSDAHACDRTLKS